MEIDQIISLKEADKILDIKSRATRTVRKDQGLYPQIIEINGKRKTTLGRTQQVVQKMKAQYSVR